MLDLFNCITMQKKFKEAIVENAEKLIDAVKSEDFVTIGAIAQFLHFAVETVLRCHSFDEYLKTKVADNLGEAISKTVDHGTQE